MPISMTALRTPPSLVALAPPLNTLMAKGYSRARRHKKYPLFHIRGGDHASSRRPSGPAFAAKRPAWRRPRTLGRRRPRTCVLQARAAQARPPTSAGVLSNLLLPSAMNVRDPHGAVHAPRHRDSRARRIRDGSARVGADETRSKIRNQRRGPFIRGHTRAATDPLAASDFICGTVQTGRPRNQEWPGSVQPISHPVRRRALHPLRRARRTRATPSPVSLEPVCRHALNH